MKYNKKMLKICTFFLLLLNVGYLQAADDYADLPPILKTYDFTGQNWQVLDPTFIGGTNIKQGKDGGSCDWQTWSGQYGNLGGALYASVTDSYAELMAECELIVTPLPGYIMSFRSFKLACWNYAEDRDRYGLCLADRLLTFKYGYVGEPPMRSAPGTIVPKGNSHLHVNMNTPITNKPITINFYGRLHTNWDMGVNHLALTHDFLTILTQRFEPSSVGIGATSNLIFTIDLKHDEPARNMNLASKLPYGLVVASTPIRSQCAGLVTATVNSRTFKFNQGDLGGGEPDSCEIKIPVKASKVGNYTHTSGSLAKNYIQSMNGPWTFDLRRFKSATLKVAANAAPRITSSTKAGLTAWSSKLVIDVESTDDKDREGNGLRYKLLTGSGGKDSGLFSINTSNGQLAFKQPPAYKTEVRGDENTYQVKVQVCDSGNACNTQTITVTVGSACQVGGDNADKDCDGIPDALEMGLSYNELGTPMPFAQDSDGDGITDESDLDSDNDGLYDAEEAGHNLPHETGRVLGSRDQYNIPLAISSGSGGITYDLADTDVDGYPDFQSKDSDGDNCYDTLEAGFVDRDNNGLLGSGNDTQLSVDQFGLVTSAKGYTKPRKTGGLYDFRNASVNNCGSQVTNNAPIIASNQSFNVLQSKLVITNYQVGSVVAHDPDGDHLLNWIITSDSSGGGLKIDVSTGALKVADSSRLALGQYTVEVSVEDDRKMVSDSVVVQVTVAAERDQEPVFTSPKYVNFLEQNNGLVIDINSEDDKDSEQSGLSYQLSSGSGDEDNAWFTLNDNSGQLAFKQSPRHDRPKDADGNNIYQVKVRVCDSSGGCAEQRLSITVTKLNALRLNIRAYLLGAFRSGRHDDLDESVRMADDLRVAGFLPLSQPYHNQPIAYPKPEAEKEGVFIQKSYEGDEKTSQSILEQSGRNAVVDWVLVELRETRDLSVVVAQQAVLLQRDGDVSMPDTNKAGVHFSDLPPGHYYVSLRHRNHLGVMTAEKVYLSTDPVLVDFTDADQAVIRAHEDYPARIFLKDGTALLWAGDVNANNWVSYYDMQEVKDIVKANRKNDKRNANKALLGYYASDVNMDGRVLYSGRSSDSYFITQVIYHSIKLNNGGKFSSISMPGGMQMP